MGIACRPILLHNEFLPAIPGKRQWDYQVLGYYDGITVMENILEECSGTLQNLFDICAKYEGEERPYLTQFLFGFHSGRADEEGFWKSRFPFTYLCLIQFDGSHMKDYKEYLDSPGYIQDEIHALQLPVNEKYLVQSYFTLDNTDLLLAVKCQTSDTGARLINNLHEDVGARHPFRVLNTYSILALKKDDINKEETVFSAGNKIDMLELRLVESSPNSVTGLFAMLYDEIKQEVKEEMNLGEQEAEQEARKRISRKALLGAEDEVIIIQKMSWKSLVKYYKDETGLFCNSNECVRTYANAVSCKIMIPLDRNAKKAQAEDSMGQSGSGMIQTKLCRNIRKMIEFKYNNLNDERSRADKKTLMMIANALGRFEYSHNSSRRAFSDYSFYQMYWPFYSFVELLSNRNMDIQLYNEGYFSFIKAMILRTQNFSKPDRVYTQITDFNTRYFDIPSKLVAIYSAFIYYLKKILNKGEKKYEFLVCPGINCKVEVKEVFERTNEKQRLFMLEMPEQQLYYPKTMMIILGHEIAHFVGTDTRNRILRKDILFEISVRLILIGMKGYLEKYGFFSENIPEEYICDGLDQEMNTLLRHYMDRYKNQDFLRDKFPDKNSKAIKNNCAFIEKYSDYSEVLMRYLFASVEDMLNYHGVPMFSFLIKKDFDTGLKNGKLMYEERDDYFAEKQKVLRTCIQNLIGNSQEESSVFTVQKEVGHIVYFLKECYADLICILMLELTLEEYLSAFERSLFDRGEEAWDLMNTEVLARIALVMTAMESDKKHDIARAGMANVYKWGKEQFSNMDKWHSQIRELNDYVYMFCCAYLKNPVKINSAELVINDRNIIYDRKILREIVKYLEVCREEFYNNIQDAEYKSMRQCYNLADMHDTDTFFDQMSDIIKKYETDIYKDIETESVL